MRTTTLGLIAVAALLAAASTASAAPVERRLHSDDVQASSFLWNDWNRFQENYHPNYALDDDPKTAWVEGAKSSGAGEWLRVRVTKLEGVTKVRLKLRNGYQKSAPLFAANARIKDITVKLLPSGRTQKATLTDAQGWQEISVAQDGGTVEAVELDVGSVYEGTKYTDLCLSDIQIYVTATTPQNPAFEKKKLGLLKDWKKQRIAAAKQFRSNAGKAMPVLAAYTLTDADGGEGSDWDKCQGDSRCMILDALQRAGAVADLKPWAASIASATKALGDPTTLIAAKVAPTDKRALPPLDGFHSPDPYDVVEGESGWWNEVTLPSYGLVGAMRTDTLRAVSTKAVTTIDDAIEAKPKACRKAKPTTFTWVSNDKVDNGTREQVRVALAVTCAKVEVRDGTMSVGMAQVLVYDDQGRLALVAGPGYVSGYTWDTVDGAEVLVSGRSLNASGNLGKLERQVGVAAK